VQRGGRSSATVTRSVSGMANKWHESNELAAAVLAHDLKYRMHYLFLHSSILAGCPHRCLPVQKLFTVGFSLASHAKVQKNLVIAVLENYLIRQIWRMRWKGSPNPTSKASGATWSSPPTNGDYRAHKHEIRLPVL